MQKHELWLRVLAILIFSMLLAGRLPGAWAGEQLTLVENGKSMAPIILPKDAAPDNVAAANDLADYIKKISGAQPEVLTGVPDPLPPHAVWVGYQPLLDKLFPGVNFNFKHPEEILLAAGKDHAVVAGRDRLAGTNQVEHGTVNAVYAFIEKQLGVRWLWPGGVGTDIIATNTIALKSFEYRHHPPFRKRHLWPRFLKDWYRQQRIWFYSYQYTGGHAYTDWWEKYHAAHPDYFALNQGERLPPFWGPERNPEGVKLCVSNPGVWSQWLENAVAKLQADPIRQVISASPNDGPGFCVCSNCLAWNNPAAPSGVLTDRYVKFWNILARGLKERLPDRDVDLGAYAYSAYRDPPLSEKLEPNIAIGFVGHCPFLGDAGTARERVAWKAWADMATRMVYRPNLFGSTGGKDGLPSVALRRTAETMRFLADNKCVGYEVDTLPNSWANQGPQYYLMAQMAYDPYLDAEAVMRDYFQRGFGPAAGDIQQYFQLLEDGTEAVLRKLDSPDGKRILDTKSIFDEVWCDSNLLARAEALMAGAEAKAAGNDLYRKRVAFVRAGLDFLKYDPAIRDAMQKIEKTRYADPAAIKAALDVYAERKAFYEAAWKDPDLRYALKTRRGIEPPKDLVEAAKNPGAAAAGGGARSKFAWLAPVAEWKMTWSDDFERADPGPDWKSQGGEWKIEKGHLVAQGGKIVSTRKFPGLQRLEFNASMDPNPMGVLSDMSPIIQGDPSGQGYLVQFGGYNNTICAIQRLGKMLARTTEQTITPGKMHHVAAELNGNMVRLTVDGKVAVEYNDQQPLFGPENEHVGFYVYQGTIRISDVKVFTAAPVEQGDAPE